MIRYALTCANEDEFEGWFSSSAVFDVQANDGRLECPMCGSKEVRKAVMAPNVARRDRGERAAFISKVRQHVRDNFDYVGERFADEARRQHADGGAERPIWGEASLAEVKSLVEDGVPVAPLPPALAPEPPRKLN
jgi:hypothetical protein